MKLSVSALEEVTGLTKEYADARRLLADRVDALNEEVRDAHKRKMPGIKAAVGHAKAAQDRLSAAIQEHADLFVKPRTFNVHGIRIGFQKGKGAISWDDADQVVALIKKHFAQDAIDTLIITKEEPSKSALANLPAAELKKLGVHIEEAGDFVVIKAADSEVDKLLKAILEEGARVAEVEES